MITQIGHSFHHDSTPQDVSIGIVLTGKTAAGQAAQDGYEGGVALDSALHQGGK